MDFVSFYAFYYKHFVTNDSLRIIRNTKVVNIFYLQTNILEKLYDITFFKIHLTPSLPLVLATTSQGSLK